MQHQEMGRWDFLSSVLIINYLSKTFCTIYFKPSAMSAANLGAKYNHFLGQEISMHIKRKL